jgi:aspartyl-tRNA(Asn)/glutamyl-tRNA(Gln) amidotransferase subunit A
MSDGDVLALSAHEVAASVRKGERSAVSVARASLAAIAERDGADKLGAFLTVDAEGALAAARTVDDQLAKARAGGMGPKALEERFALAGVAVAVKDVLTTRGLRTTCASKMLQNYVPPYDAHVVSKLRASGAVIVGKTNMDEFAMGSSTENSAYFPSKNPWDPTRTPGGSSGGSAVAVAARMAHLSLGTDTGGSVRQPAALTGIVGFKPSYGRVSRYGLVAFASSLDVVSPFATNVRDAEAVFAAIAGVDAHDSTCVDRPVPRADFSRGAKVLEGVRVGVPKEYFAEGMSPSVSASVRDALAKLEAQGAKLVEVSMPHTAYGIAAYYVLAPAECSSNLARFDGVRYGLRVPSEKGSIDDQYGRTREAGFGPEVKRRILLGTFALSEGYYDAFYGKAQKVRTLIAQDFEKAFAHVDVLATPTSPVPAWKLGERTSDPLAMYLADVCTLPASLAGLPALSLPTGTTVREGDRDLPVGLQLIGRAFEEAALLEIAYGAERVLGVLGDPNKV